MPEFEMTAGEEAEYDRLVESSTLTPYGARQRILAGRTVGRQAASTVIKAPQAKSTARRHRNSGRPAGDNDSAYDQNWVGDGYAVIDPGTEDSFQAFAQGAREAAIRFFIEHDGMSPEAAKALYMAQHRH